jgi:hypothetical protein
MTLPRPLIALALLVSLAPPLLAAGDVVADASDAGNDESTRLIVIGVLVAVGLGLLNAVGQVLNIVKHFRSEPPLHTIFATKAEAKEIECRINERLIRIERETEAQLEVISKTLHALEKAMADIGRAIGRLEGAQDTKPQRRA